jgi:hypothetical protein
MKKSRIIAAICAVLVTAALGGCSNSAQTSQSDTVSTGSSSSLSSSSEATKAAPIDTSGFTKITLADNNTIAADGITINGNEITVTKGGNYSFSGSLTDGRIVIEASESDDVTVLLDGVSITDKTGSAPVFVQSANGVTLLTSGTNSLIDEGGFFGDSNDDTAGIWSLSDIYIGGDGTLSLPTSGKAIHSEKAISIESGNISIEQSDEGIEASLININGGNIAVVSTDDGINVSDGAYTADTLYINGGNLSVNAQGDGIDSNGAIVMTGGDVSVDGPTGMDNAALDFDKTFTMTGGTLFAIGSAGMAAVPSDGEQSFISANVSGKAGSTITIKNAVGEYIGEHIAAKDFASVVFSSPEITKGETFSVFVDNTEAGTAVAGESNNGRGGGGFGGFFGGGFAPPDGEFAPPDGEFTPPDGEFTPPDGEFAPPNGEFAPPENRTVS